MKLNRIGNNETELTNEADTVVVLFSYDTPVAARVETNYSRTIKHYSKTTTRHSNKWLPANAYVSIVDQQFLDALVVNNFPSKTGSK